MGDPAVVVAVKPPGFVVKNVAVFTVRMNRVVVVMFTIGRGRHSIPESPIYKLVPFYLTRTLGV